jgi:hypothetical protein
MKEEPAMGEPRIVEERDNYLLICDGGRYAVVERRRGLYYSLHADGRREGVPLGRLPSALPAKDWSELAVAARILEEVVERRRRLAENIW